MSLLIGLDVGTTSVKAGLFDASGRLLGAAAEEYRLDHPGPDRAELDPDVYWTATRAAIGRVLASPRADPDAVAAVAVSSQGETVIAVDEQGRPLAPALVWLDNRAADEAAGDRPALRRRDRLRGHRRAVRRPDLDRLQDPLVAPPRA